MTRARHGYAFGAKGCSIYTFWERCSGMTFLRARKWSTQKVLQKELMQVRESKVVVGEGLWDHRGPVARLRARKDPLVVAKSLCKRPDDHNKTRCQGFRGEFWGGS